MNFTKLILFQFAVIYIIARCVDCHLIIDAFCYQGEPISHFRIAYLQDVVDHFVLIESNYAESGRGPSMHKNTKHAHNSLNASGKVIVEQFTTHEPHSHTHSHMRLKLMRDAIRETVLRLFPAEEFILIVSAADEIPNKNIIKSLNYSTTFHPSHLFMTRHVYSFDWTTSELFSQAFTINSEGLRKLTKSISDIRGEPFRSYHNVIVSAGWKCMHFNSPHVLAKIMASARDNEVSVIPPSCLKELTGYFLEIGLDFLKGNFSEKSLLTRYSGSNGYPYCDACQAIPEYSYFAIPSQLNGTRIAPSVCVPVLGVGIVGDTRGFFVRLVKSIDSCVSNFVLVKSSYVNASEGISLLRGNKFVQNVTIVNIDAVVVSCAEGWNIIVGSFPSAPWYALVAYDVYFLPGHLQKFAERFWRESGRKDLASIPKCILETKHDFGFIPHITKLMAFPNWVNMIDAGKYNFFAIDSTLVTAAGAFDENFYPAFFEDTDWTIRTSLVTGSVVTTFTDVLMYHGDAEYDPNFKYKKNIKSYVPGTYYLVSAIKDYIPFRTEGNMYSKAYIQKKWGCDDRVANCEYKTPFNDSSLPLSYWEKDVAWIQSLLTKYNLNPHNITVGMVRGSKL